VARELGDPPLTQLDAALQVMPSPEAVSRVRERVRQEQTTSRAPYGWWWAAAAGVAVVAVGIASAFVLTSHRAPAAGPAIAATNTSASSDVVGPRVVEAAPGLSARHVARAQPTRTIAHPAVVLIVERPREPEVLVPPDEGIALRRLLIALREGRATVPSAGLRGAEDAEGHLVQPAPIEIPLIKIELLPGTPVAGPGGIVK
jgi:hypothetical protein